jgi:hypothetical protein
MQYATRHKRSSRPIEITRTLLTLLPIIVPLFLEAHCKNVTVTNNKMTTAAEHPFSCDPAFLVGLGVEADVVVDFDVEALGDSEVVALGDEVLAVLERVVVGVAAFVRPTGWIPTILAAEGAGLIGARAIRLWSRSKTVYAASRNGIPRLYGSSTSVKFWGFSLNRHVLEVSICPAGTLSSVKSSGANSIIIERIGIVMLRPGKLTVRLSVEEANEQLVSP